MTMISGCFAPPQLSTHTAQIPIFTFPSSSIASTSSAISISPCLTTLTTTGSSRTMGSTALSYWHRIKSQWQILWLQWAWLLSTLLYFKLPIVVLTAQDWDIPREQDQDAGTSMRFSISCWDALVLELVTADMEATAGLKTVTCWFPALHTIDN